jgi:hypothetical protein
MDKKNKDCNILTAKRAEYRLAESLRDLPKESTSKKVFEEDEQEKVKSYLRLCKKPSSHMVIQVVRELVRANV